MNLIKSEDIDFILPYITEMKFDGDDRYTMEIIQPPDLKITWDAFQNFSCITFMDEMTPGRPTRVELTFKNLELFYYLVSKKQEYDKADKCFHHHGGITDVYVFEASERACVSIGQQNRISGGPDRLAWNGSKPDA